MRKTAIAVGAIILAASLSGCDDLFDPPNWCTNVMSTGETETIQCPGGFQHPDWVRWNPTTNKFEKVTG